jgi:S1-C subfamily serine protease
VTPLERGPHSRIFIPLLVAVLGIAIGVGAVVALRPLETASAAGPTASAAAEERPADQSAALARPLSDRAIYARVEPSVVDVTAALRSSEETASGTGFIIYLGALYVLTNNHVIRDATSVTVTIPATGRTYRARIVGADPSADIAVLQASSLPARAAATLGDSARVAVGSAVVAIGNRAGTGGPPALAPGVISGIGATIEASDGATKFTETLHGLLATTARIVPGDSGGPLADAAGAVIGVDTAAGTGGAEPGYAIPIDAAMAAVRQILGHASAHLGI